MQRVAQNGATTIQYEFFEAMTIRCLVEKPYDPCVKGAYQNCNSPLRLLSHRLWLFKEINTYEQAVVSTSSSAVRYCL